MNITTTSQYLSPEEIVNTFRSHLREALLDAQVLNRTDGEKKTETVQIWLTINKQVIKKTVRRLIDLHFPHLVVISGCDTGEHVELMYHFFIYYGRRNGEYNVTLKTALPKNDLTIDTIADILPGALTSEREKQEFFGISINDIPDGRRIFLPNDFPEGVYPWRKDDTGIKDHMVKKLYAVGREQCGAEVCCRDKIPTSESPENKEPEGDKNTQDQTDQQ